MSCLCTVLTGDNHGMICVWEKETGNTVQLLPLAHAKAVISLSISSDGFTIASVGADDKVCIWSVDMGIELVSGGRHHGAGRGRDGLGCVLTDPPTLLERLPFVYVVQPEQSRHVWVEPG